MAKKRINKAGHVFGGHVGGIDYFRQNDGKWTDSGGVLVEPGYAKILDQFFPQEIKDEKTPLKANKPPKKTRKPEPVIAPPQPTQVAKLEVQEPNTSALIKPIDTPPDTSALISAASNPIATLKPEKLKKEKKKKSEPEDEKAEDNPSRSKRILRAMYPDLFTTGEKLREIWTGKEEKEELEKKNKRKRKAAAKSGDDEEPDQEGSTRGGRIFDAMYPGVRKKAGDLKRIWTGDKNKNDEQQKEKSEKKRQETDKRYNFEKIKDDLNDNGDYLRDLIVVQQRTANILSQILDKIDNLGGGDRKDNDLPDKKKFDLKDQYKKKGNTAKTAAALLPMMLEAADLTKEEIEEKLNAEANPAPDDIMNQPITKVISDWWNGDKKKEATPVAAGPLSIQATGTGTVEELTAAMNAKAAGNGAPGAVSDIATSKETTAIAEAKQTQVKAENILTFKADEIKFNADRLTFEVQSLTIENKGQAPAGATGPSGGNEGSSGGGGATPKDASSTAGGGTGASPGGTGTPNVEGAPVTGPGKDKSSAPPPTLTEEQKKDLGALTGEGIKSDDPRAKQFSGLNDEQLKSAGIEKTPDGGFKQAPTAASGMTDEEVAKKAGTGKFRPEYKLTSADLSDDVLNTIAGEARMKDPASVDAVINSMFNRVGAKGYGPSANLQQVARAPGQYKGYRKATEKEKAMLRERIQAVADGNVEDTTKGADQYRATSYMEGAGAGKTASRTATEQGSQDLGGNTFFKSKNAQTGPYAAYATTGKEPPPSGPATPEQIAQKRQKLENQEVTQRQTALAGALNTKQTPAAIKSTSAPVTTSAARPEMTAEDKKALAGEELTPTNPAAFGRGGGHLTGESFELTKSQREQQFGPPEPVTGAVPEFNVGANLLPDATKLPGGDEGMKDREVRSANMQHASNVAEKEPIVQQNVAKLESGRDGDTSGDDSWNKSGGGDAAPIPEPPRRPAELTAPPPEADNTPAPQPQRRPAEVGKNTRQSTVESHSPMPGGNGAQFLETVFRMLPYLLHQKKHAPQAGRRWHY
jgi:hypothetical protein